MRPSTMTGRILTASAAALLFGACGKMPESHREAAFQRAIPSHEQVGIDVPGSSNVMTKHMDEIADEAVPGGGRRVIRDLGDLKRATFYTVTRDMSAGINGGVLGLLIVIKAIAQSPPSVVTETHRYYGPWSSALDPLTYAFVMDVTSGDDIKYALIAKPKHASDAEYKAVLGGTYHPVSEDRGTGTLGLDADAAQALDPAGDHGGGRIGIRWNNATQPRSVEVAFDHWRERRGDETIDALYRYREAPDTSGTFEFLVKADIDGSRDLGKLAKENVGIVSRWAATGTGRSDVVITGGDLPVSEVHMQECWNDAFVRTFYTDDHNVFPTEGDPSACPHF